MNKPKIAVIGSLNMDIVIEARRPPQMGETIMGEQAHFIPGGKGANQAVASARLGASTVMIGAVGQDAFGKQLLDSMQQEGIDCKTIKTVEQAATGIASILLAQGDNSIIVIAGANGHCTPDDIDRHEQSIAAADVILLQLEIPLATVVYAAEKAKRLGKLVILNPAPAQRLPDTLYASIDILTPNETEVFQLAGCQDGEAELQTAMQALQHKGVGNVITTLGSKGAAFLDQETGQLVTLPAYKVPVVDTTGAGDSFNAGLAFALGSGKRIPEAVIFASRVAALAVTKMGAQQGMPTLDQVENFMRKQG